MLATHASRNCSSLSLLLSVHAANCPVVAGYTLWSRKQTWGDNLGDCADVRAGVDYATAVGEVAEACTREPACVTFIVYNNGTNYCFKKVRLGELPGVVVCQSKAPVSLSV